MIEKSDELCGLSTLRRVRSLIIGVAILAILGACGGQGASSESEGDWTPDRPITIIVPAGPGGGSDQMAREAVKVMEEIDSDVKFVVENVSGGGGAAGVGTFLKRASDGYTFLQVPAADISLLISEGQIDARLDAFSMVGKMQSGPATILSSNSDSRFSSYDEMIEYMKASGDSLKAAMYIPEGFDDITLKAIEDKEDVEFTRVPYTDGGERFTALLSGRADILLQRYGDVVSYIEDDKMSPMLVNVSSKPEVLKDVPNFKDVGIEFGADYSRGFWASADVPEGALEYMRRLVRKAAESDKWIESQSDKGYFDGYMEPTEWRAQLEDLMKMYKETYG